MIRRLGATEKVVQQSMRSALGKMAAWTKTRSARGLSKELKLQQKILRRRMRAKPVRRTSRGAQATLWYGLNNVPLIYLNARRNRRGVAAYAGRQGDAGFIATGGRRPTKEVFKREGRARMPIKRQTESIAQESTGYLEDMIGEAEYQAHFQKLFLNQLQWRMQRQK